MLALARHAGPTVEGYASGGSTTTIINAGFGLVPEGKVDDAFNLGTAFVVTDAGGAGAAPQGELQSILDYDASTGTVTTAGAFTAAVAASDYVALTTVRRDLLYSAVNNALRDAGRLPAEDVSLTTAASTREYTIPSAAKGDLRQVWIAGKTSRPYDFEECHYWRQVRNKSTYDLEFQYQPPSGYPIRLVYCAPHTTVSGYSNSIQDIIPLDWLTWRSAYHLYRWRLHQEGRDDKKWTALMNEAAEYAAQIKPQIKLPPRTPRYWLTPDVSDGGAHIETEEIPFT